MSTFPGPIEEIPGISVDCFNEENLESSVYFLSHAHSDHTKGLDIDFIQYLERNNKFLYCSEITKAILNAQSFLPESIMIKGLSLLNPILIDFKGKNDTVFVTVTLIPAGHCPGSVMFLFAFNNKKILYTGDFRINSSDFHKLKPLHDYDGENLYPMKFDKIYLDTTFLNLDYSKIPTRKESVEEIRKVAKDWLGQDSKNVILLKLTYNYGLEYVFKEISMALNRKVHVKDSVYEVYRRIPEIIPFITNNPESTPLHACETIVGFKNRILSCRQDIDEINVLAIHLTAMKWGGKLESGIISEWDQIEREFSVCYSSHASCDELKAFLQYFPAKEVYPCVAKTKNDLDRIYELLAQFARKEEHKNVEKESSVEFIFPKAGSSADSFKSEIFSDDDID